jgi:hypothetical protein
MYDNEFDFLYDWRLDPYTSAAQLDAYIDEIIEVTGHDKVIINAYSEGGEISLEYVTSPKVSGARVKIGDGCRIDLLEYSESYEISPKAKVSKIFKIL